MVDLVVIGERKEDVDKVIIGRSLLGFTPIFSADIDDPPPLLPHGGGFSSLPTFVPF